MSCWLPDAGGALTVKHRRLCSVQKLCLSHSLAKALLTFLQFTWIPCSPPHLPQVTPSHLPTIFTSSSDYLSTCYVSTTILLWCVTLKSWPGWCSSLPLFPGQSQYLEHIPNFLSMACNFHSSHQILHCSYLSSNQLLLTNLRHRLSFCLLSCNCLFSPTLWRAAGIYSTQFES